MMRGFAPSLAALLVLALAAACGEGARSPAGDATTRAEDPAPEATPVEPAADPALRREEVDVVLYGIGLSTDPYVDDRPKGIGVASGVAEGELRRSEIHDDELLWFGPPQWVDDSTVVATRRGPPYRPPLLFTVRTGEIEVLGPAPLRSLEPVGIWSPDGMLVATEPIARCEPEQGVDGCYRQSGVVEVIAGDGERKRISGWHLSGWAADGRLLVTDDRGEEHVALDVTTARAEPVIDRTAVAELAGERRVGVGKPIWSADGRYLAAFAGVPWGRNSGKVGTVVVARADGTPVRLVSSPSIISMLAWSPVGHRLAFTTSGFPDPHELFVLDEPDGKPRKIFATGDRHFDWVTWSPDGRYLLVDDATFGFDPLRPGRPPPGRWLMVDPDDGTVLRELERLGGAPQWCCPASSYVTLNG